LCIVLSEGGRLGVSHSICIYIYREMDGWLWICHLTDLVGLVLCSGVIQSNGNRWVIKATVPQNLVDASTQHDNNNGRYHTVHFASLRALHGKG
jgi:hypothetical protein